MTIVYDWNDLIAETLTHFPDCDARTLRARAGDIGALVMHLSARHELTFAEAAEMVTFRLPAYCEISGPRLLRA